MPVNMPYYLCAFVSKRESEEKAGKIERERKKPITSHVDPGNTTPVLGLTQYFFGFVVLTYNTMNFTPDQNYNSP